MGCFSGGLMSSASDQKLFCKLCSPFCCSFDEFVEEKVISPSYSFTILTPPVDILLNGWWWGERESASSASGSNPPGVSVLVGIWPSLTFNFSHLVGVSVSAKHNQKYCCAYPLKGNQTLPQGCTIVSWLFPPCLHIPSLPLLAADWTCFFLTTVCLVKAMVFPKLHMDVRVGP